jgi:glutathione peroxidase
MGLYDLSVRTLEGADQPLQTYAGKVLLIVNVASRCGFTPQYAGLERLWQQYGARGLVVLGFPCNQFGRQEPGTASEIKEFCTEKYQVTFPLFAKIDVNGAEADPLYSHLKAAAPGVLGSEAIKWNFTKFLIDRSGEVLQRYGSVDTPEKISKDIAAAL